MPLESQQRASQVRESSRPRFRGKMAPKEEIKKKKEKKDHNKQAGNGLFVKKGRIFCLNLRS